MTAWPRQESSGAIPFSHILNAGSIAVRRIDGLRGDRLYARATQSEPCVRGSSLPARRRRGRRGRGRAASGAEPSGTDRGAADAKAVLHRTPRSDDPLLAIFLEGAILGAFAAERLRERHVPLVARVREDAPAVERRQRHRHRPGTFVRHRIVHGHLVLHDVLRHPLEPLRQLQLRAGAVTVAVQADRRAVGEVRCLDDELVADPAALRVAQILLDRGPRMRPAVGRDDARVVDHLVRDRDDARALRNLGPVAVDDAQRGSEDPARDAPLVEGEIRRPVERSVAVGAARHRPLCALGREGRQAAVGWIDNQGRLVECASREVETEGADGFLVALGDAALDLLRPLRELFRVQVEAIAELRGSRHRDAARVVGGPDALEIRIAPRRPGRHEARVRRLAAEGRDDQRRRSRGLRLPQHGDSRQIPHARDSCQCHRRTDCGLSHRLPLFIPQHSAQCTARAFADASINMTSMRVFVTGATGFIGRALVPRLQRDGHTIVAWARSATRARALLGADVEIVTGALGARRR